LLDCCGDSKYSSLIDWGKIEQNGVPVYHAIDPQREGGQVRAEAGFLAASMNEEMLRRIKGCEKFSGVNADIEFTTNHNFQTVGAIVSGHLPRVGVINTKLNEYDSVSKYAKRQGWNRHFRFEAISTPKALGNSYKDGIEQCICLIPNKGHHYLVQWCSGRQLKDVRGDVFMVRSLKDLLLKFSIRP
jgi:hypothetical protein